MSLYRPQTRRRWFHFTIGRMMLALPVTALAIVVVAGIDPFQQDPNQQAINQSIRACSSNKFTFEASYRYDWSQPKPVPILDKPRLVNGNCVLVFSEPGDVVSNRREVETYGMYEAIADDGRWQSWHRRFIGVGGSSGTITPEQMSAIKKILPTLPHSQASIPIGLVEEGNWSLAMIEPQQRFESRALVLGFRRQGAWVTRVYDNKQAPIEVIALMKVLGHNID